MNELVKVDFDTQTVSARDLYSLLNVSKRFSAWFETNSQGFVNGVDFEGAYLKVQSNQFGGEKEIQDYSDADEAEGTIPVIELTKAIEIVKGGGVNES